MSRILVPACGVDDWRKLLADPLRHWKRGFSAYETAHRWQSARSLPHELAAILGVEAELLAAIPEHQVAMPGHGRNSQCDVFALVRVGERTIAAAIEGKVDETFGPTIGAWLTNASAGKLCRLASICEMLGLAYPPNGALRYQLFHRTAAAIVEADRFGTTDAAMLVHSFSPEHRWFEDFAAFCRLFDVEAKPGTAHRVSIPGQRALLLGWATGPLSVPTPRAEGGLL